MAKSKFPKIHDNNEAVSKVAAQPNLQADETPDSFAAATSTTKAESTKAKAPRSRATKSAVANSAPKLEAVPDESRIESRTNGESRSNGESQPKIEVRRNVVPINVEDEIRKLAYLLSERRGFVPGHEREDWLAAEREVMQRYRQHTA